MQRPNSPSVAYALQTSYVYGTSLYAGTGSKRSFAIEYVGLWTLVSEAELLSLVHDSPSIPISQAKEKELR